jgi:hypothetical protein
MTTMQQPTAPSDRSTTFQAVEGNQKEQYSGGTLLVIAYAALWLVLFAWVAIVWRKQSALHARLADLERVIDEADADAAKRDGGGKGEGEGEGNAKKSAAS